MPGAARLGDTSTGHGSFPPMAADQGSPNVLINGIPAHRQGDHWAGHSNGKSWHDGVLLGGSSTVLINGRPAGRIGDAISCGDTVATGSGNVIIG